jgi:hypothetical protein
MLRLLQVDVSKSKKNLRMENTHVAGRREKTGGNRMFCDHGPGLGSCRRSAAGKILDDAERGLTPTPKTNFALRAPESGQQSWSVVLQRRFETAGDKRKL